MVRDLGGKRPVLVSQIHTAKTALLRLFTYKPTPGAEGNLGMGLEGTGPMPSPGLSPAASSMH